MNYIAHIYPFWNIELKILNSLFICSWYTCILNFPSVFYIPITYIWFDLLMNSGKLTLRRSFDFSNRYEYQIFNVEILCPPVGLSIYFMCYVKYHNTHTTVLCETDTFCFSKLYWEGKFNALVLAFIYMIMYFRYRMTIVTFVWEMPVWTRNLKSLKRWFRVLIVVDQV